MNRQLRQVPGQGRPPCIYPMGEGQQPGKPGKAAAYQVQVQPCAGQERGGIGEERATNPTHSPVAEAGAAEQSQADVQ